MKKPRGGRSFSPQSRRVESRGRPAAEGRVRAQTGGRSAFDDRLRWVPGLHSAREAVRVRPGAVREVCIRKEARRSQEILELLRDLEKGGRASVREVDESLLDRLSSGHQGIALGLDDAPSLTLEDLVSGPPEQLVLALDEVEDPQNLGGMLRTAWLQGVRAILVPEMRSARLSPSVCKVASGGAEHVALVRCDNLAIALGELKEAGFWIYGLAEEGESLSWQIDVAERAVWVVGSESSGLRTTVRRACDDLVRIDQVNTGSSYNAATAAALALYETSRQRARGERRFR